MKTNENEQILHNVGISSAKPNLNSLDLFKFIMAILVVAIHTRPQDSFSAAWADKTASSITGLAVPFFFLASGYLLARKFKGMYYEKENRPAVLKSLKRIVKLYLIWTAIYFPVSAYAYYKNGYSIIYSIAVTARRILFRGQFENIQVLWYLLSTVYALIFILAMMRLKVRPRALAVISFAVLVIAAGVNYISECNQALPQILMMIKQAVNYTIVSGGVLSGIAYIPFGMLVYNNKKLIKYGKYLFLPFFVLMFFIKNPYIRTVVEPFEMIAFFSLALCIRLKDRSVFKFLRASSTSIYLIHMYVFMAFSYIVYNELNCTGIVSFTATSLIAVILSAAYYFIVKKIKTAKTAKAGN